MNRNCLGNFLDEITLEAKNALHLLVLEFLVYLCSTVVLF